MREGGGEGEAVGTNAECGMTVREIVLEIL